MDWIARVLYHQCMRRDTRLFLVATIAALTTSCARTRAVPLSPAPKFAAQQHVSVWQGPAATQLVHVQILNDTVHGRSSAACDSCSTSIPLSEVDSLTTRSGNEWAWAIPLGVAAGVMIVWRATDSD